MIVGTLEAWTIGSTSYQDEVHIALLRLEDGSRRALWVLGSVLQDEFRENRPKLGDAIAVAYHGEKTSAAGTKYQHYRLAVDRDEEPRPAPPPAPKAPPLYDQAPPF